MVSLEHHLQLIDLMVSVVSNPQNWLVLQCAYQSEADDFLEWWHGLLKAQR